jgi:hypothetical protein
LGLLPGGCFYNSLFYFVRKKAKGVGVCKTMLGKLWGVVLAVQISVYMDAGTPAACIRGVGGPPLWFDFCCEPPACAVSYAAMLPTLYGQARCRRNFILLLLAYL